MNEEYLWNKTGSDAEIEWLESSLKGFAFKPTSVPEMPTRQIVVAAPRQRSLFSLRFAFAAACLLMMASVAVWIFAPARRQTTSVAATEEKTQPIAPATPSGAQLAVDRNNKPPSSKVLPVRAVSKPVVRKAIRPQTLVLTKEEADAYRQLMTALSITSTNLKIVKDALNGGTE